MRNLNVFAIIVVLFTITICSSCDERDWDEQYPIYDVEEQEDTWVEPEDIEPLDTGPQWTQAELEEACLPKAKVWVCNDVVVVISVYERQENQWILAKEVIDTGGIMSFTCTPKSTENGYGLKMFYTSPPPQIEIKDVLKGGFYSNCHLHPTANQ